MESNINLDINIPKKRGRKPKIKNLESNENIEINNKPKKRGRKPKTIENEKVKVPKKRGRKPNIFNTKQILNNTNTDKLIKKDNVLHLKINTTDLNDNNFNNNIYEYDPNLNEPLPYENLDSLSGISNYLTLEEKQNLKNVSNLNKDNDIFDDINNNNT